MTFTSVHIRHVFSIAILLLCLASKSEARSIVAASASYDDVQSAVTAAATGDVVLVPGGTATWTSTLTITKGIQIIGKGTGLSGTTIINNVQYTAAAGTTPQCFYYRPASYATPQTFRMSGFTIDVNGRYGLFVSEGDDTSPPYPIHDYIRIDNNRFINSASGVSEDGGQALWHQNAVYGVVDNNVFDGIDYPIKNDPSVGVDDWWDTAPQNTFELGSKNYPYFEDNQFINMNALGAGSDNILTDGQFSARYVFRYNTIINNVATSSMFEVHGQQGNVAGQMASCFGVELYGNDYTAANNDMVGFFSQRSGQTRVFWNNATTTSSYYNKAYTTIGTDVCPSAYADLKITHNSYWWGNRKNMTGGLSHASPYVTGGLTCNSLTDIPLIGRDIISDDYATTGTSVAITQGTLAARPATCTTGEGYWATDQNTSDLTNYVGRNPTTPISGTMYKCTATDVWTADYTPYTYPHPMRSIMGIDFWALWLHGRQMTAGSKPLTTGTKPMRGL